MKHRTSNRKIKEFAITREMFGRKDYEKVQMLRNRV